MSDKKIAQAGLRFLKLLKELAQKPLTTNELLLVLEEVNNNVYRKEVVNKYLNTLKLLGFEIEKVKDKYCLQRGLDRIDFDETDLSLIMFLGKYTDSLRHETLKESVFEALQTVEKGFSSKTIEIINSKKVKMLKPKNVITIKDENIKKFEKYCKEHLRIELTYKKDAESAEKTYKISPINLLYKKGKAVLIGHDYELSEFKEFVIDNIIESKQTPQKNTPNFISAVTFKLKDRLAKAYKLKTDEKVIESGEGFIVVSNNKEDRDLLVKRLLRYKNQCEILYPKSCREKMMNLINEMEVIYAE